MSARDFSDAGSRAVDDRARSRAHGRLTLSVLLGPVVALVQQGVIYIAAASTCSSALVPILHTVSALSLVLIVSAGGSAYRSFRRPVRRGDESAPVERRHFLARVGLLLNALSAVVVLAQWVAVIVFPPCVRA